MKRSQPLRRTRWKTGGPDTEREPKPAAEIGIPTSVRSLHRGTYAGSTSGLPVAKEEPLRSQALRDMAEGRPCMLLVPAVCNHRTDTTVLCHENQGKGMSTKRTDERAVWGCAACHDWYDRSGAPREQKRAQFAEAIGRQELAYGAVAADPTEPERHRRAARLALDHLNTSRLEHA